MTARSFVLSVLTGSSMAVAWVKSRRRSSVRSVDLANRSITASGSRSCAHTVSRSVGRTHYRLSSPGSGGPMASRGLVGAQVFIGFL